MPLWGPSMQHSLKKALRFHDIMAQIQLVAVNSLPTILFCLGFAAMVTVIESSYHMRLVIQNDSLVPGFSAVLILKEIGVVVTALLMTSRIGAAISAEVGLMKTTEQIDALKMLGINPVHYLYIPRLLGCFVGLVCLTVFANAFCLFCAALVSNLHLGFSYGLFLSSLRRFVQFQDFFLSIIKGAVFGLIIPSVSCYYGFHCKDGAEGVGQATTNSVVTASVLIIISDFILSFTFSYL